LTFAKIKVVKQAMRASRGRGFARECLGVWPRRKKGVGNLDLAKWAKLGDPSSRRHGDVALAIDIAPDRSYAAIALYGLRADGFPGPHAGP
jgi:macrodomain Ter protein organizer (MatP/YcbG family)